MDEAAVDQGGLGLPDRDYYLKTDDRSSDAAKTDYRTSTSHRCSTLAGRRPQPGRGRRRRPCCAIETALAEGRRSTAPRDAIRGTCTI